jgi:hypothetical protein
MGDLTTSSPASEVPFRVSFSGHGGHLRLDPTPNPPSPIPEFVLVRDPLLPHLLNHAFYSMLRKRKP